MSKPTKPTFVLLKALLRQWRFKCRRIDYPQDQTSTEETK